MSSALTRRGLVTAASAALGAIALPASTSAPAPAETSPKVAAEASADADLFALLSRQAEALAQAKAAEVDLDAAEAIVHAAYDSKPEALFQGGQDFILGIGRCSGHAGEGRGARRFFLPDDIERLQKLSDAYWPTTPWCERVEARRREIIAAGATWKAATDRARATTGYDALSDRFDEAWEAVAAVERDTMAMPARTLAGLCAKAALAVEIADRRGVEHVPVDFARQVAAFGRPDV